VINFVSNNYLGFCNHPRIIKAVEEMMKRRGFGMASGRAVSCTTDVHKQLEAKCAEFMRMEDAYTIPSGMDSNTGFFGAVLT
jgi:glycine C-acetyltransferase